MTQRPLNSDQLGKKGEQRFIELCVDAGLYPNGSTWDRTGWDAVVDWPFTPSAKLSLDKRPIPLSCRVQVKTLWAGNHIIKVNLAAMERLAKEPKPSFIQIFHVDTSLTYVGSSVIHVEGTFLAMILQRLRQAEFDQRAAAKVEFSFSTEKWCTGLPDVSGAAFRAFVEDISGTDLERYISAKAKSVASAGYENGSISLQTKLVAKDHEEIIEALFGLRQIEAIDLESSETRFGITLPFPEMNADKAALQFQPKAIDNCLISFSNGPAGEKVTFNGKLYGLPGNVLPPGEARCLVRTNLFRFTMLMKKASGVADLRCTFASEAEAVRASRLRAEEWAEYYKLITMIDEGEVHLRLDAKKKPAPMTGTFRLDQPIAKLGRWRALKDMAAAAMRILVEAGAPNTKLSIDDIEDAKRDLQYLTKLLDQAPERRKLGFTSDHHEGIAIGTEVELLYFDAFLLGRHRIAFCLRITLMADTITNGVVTWAEAHSHLVNVSRIGLSDAELARLLERTRRTQRLDIHIVAYRQNFSADN